MTYLGLIRGATGIQYFIRRPPNGAPVSPSLWSECRRLALEIQELSPALLSTAQAPAVQSSDPAVCAAAWSHAGAVIVLAANTENRPVPVQLRLGEPFSGEADVLFASRRLPVAKGVITDTIDGFGTRAYQIAVGPEPEPRASLSAGNLTVNPSFEESTNAGSPDGCYVMEGKDPGASLLVDPRLAVHGRHSLRVCTPTARGGLRIVPFPIAVKAGTHYRLSIWARGLQTGRKFRFGLAALGCGEKEFLASREWAEYSLVGVAKADNARANIGLELLSQGTCWFDLMQMVEVAGPS